jgi:hypothetical protein
MASRVPGSRLVGIGVLTGALLAASIPAPAAATTPSIAQQAYAKASNTGAGDEFGYSVAVSGNTMVVGAAFEASSATGVNGNQSDNGAANSGAAYVFVRTGTTWTQQAYLKASNSGADDRFGAAVAVSGDTIVVSAPEESSAATGVDGDQASNAAPQSGAVYVFVRNGSTWTQQAYLKASNAEAHDWFGIAVAVSGSTIVVGASSEASAATGVNGDGSSNAAPNSGAAYVFTSTAGVWSQQAYLKASNTESTDLFGTAVGISGDTLIVGAPSEASAATGVNGNQASNTVPGAGAAYVFARSGALWTEQAYLKASNTGVDDNFGTAVGVSGTTAVVGAPFESSAAVGVNGDQSSNAATAAGAAYVFTSTAGAWSQQAYLKASNTDAGDWFGDAVAASGDSVVIGAPIEASEATGVNGVQGNNKAYDAGAAYLFARSGGAWTQQAYLKASNTEYGDNFGAAVAASGDTIVAGADGEGSAATGINGNQADNSAAGAGAVYAFYRSPLGTRTTLSSLSTVKAGTTLKLSGTVAPAGPGTVSISRYHYASGAWRLAGRTSAKVLAGRYSALIKLSTRGKWRFYAAYSGGAGGGATYLPSRSVVKSVSVR